MGKIICRNTGKLLCRLTDTISQAVNLLNEGHLINIFPEGEMNRSDEILLPFKRGAVTMAQKSNSKIIPFVVKGEWKFHSKDLRIIFGEAIDVSSLSFEEGNGLLYNTIKKMLLNDSL